VLGRALPYWYDAIIPDLQVGRTVLVAAHGNSLRALVKHLDGISDEAIAKLNIPTGIPLRYDLDPVTLRPVTPAASTSTRRPRSRRPPRWRTRAASGETRTTTADERRGRSLGDSAESPEATDPDHDGGRSPRAVAG